MPPYIYPLFKITEMHGQYISHQFTLYEMENRTFIKWISVYVRIRSRKRPVGVYNEQKQKWIIFETLMQLLEMVTFDILILKLA